MYKKESVKLAFTVFHALLAEGVVTSNDGGLLQAYKTQPEVREILADIIEPGFDVQVLNAVEKLYLTPGINNKLLGYSNQQLRQSMGLQNNVELYMAYFVMLCLLAMFYNSETLDAATRQYVPLKELEDFITSKLENIGRMEEITAAEAQLEFAFTAAASFWQELPPYDEKLKSLVRSKRNRVSFVLNVCRFLQGQDLIVVHEEREIYWRERLDCMVRRYYADSRRKEQLMNFLLNEQLNTTS